MSKFTVKEKDLLEPYSIKSAYDNCRLDPNSEFIDFKKVAPLLRKADKQQQFLREAYTVIVNNHVQPGFEGAFCRHCSATVTKGEQHKDGCIVPVAQKWLEENKE